MASSQEVSLLLSQRLFYNAWLTTAAGRIDTGGIVLFICSTKMHEFGSKVMCETTFTATQCRALSRWVWFKMAEKNESKGDLEPAMRVIMLTVKGKLMKKKDGECSGWALMNFTTGFTTYASGKTATFLFFSKIVRGEPEKVWPLATFDDKEVKLFSIIPAAAMLFRSFYVSLSRYKLVPNQTYSSEWKCTNVIHRVILALFFLAKPKLFL